MFKKITAILLVLLTAISLISCAGNKKPSTTTPETTEDPRLKDGPVLNIRVKSAAASKFVSERPYDESKEDITLILVIGQSNFTINAGFSWEYGFNQSGKSNVPPEDPIRPASKGIAYSVTTSDKLASLRDKFDMNSLSNPKNGYNTLGGVTPPFATRWNELTGTKVVFIQAAVEATGVDEWVKDPSVYNCPFHDFGEGVLYKNAVDSFAYSYEALKEKYNIVYTGYIWNQGEKDEINNPGCPIISDDLYYETYKSMHDSLMEDLDLDFGGISVVRANQAGDTAEASNSYTKARAAQYRLTNDIDNLFMLSTISETCVRSEDMDQGNTVHYTQKIFNRMGTEMAENLFKRLGLSETPAQYGGITIDGSDGHNICKIDADGNLIAGSDLLTDAINRIQVKLSTLGTACTYEFNLTVDGEDMNQYIDKFGKIDWAKFMLATGLDSIKIIVTLD